MVKFRIQFLKIDFFFNIIFKFVKKGKIFFRKNGFLSRRSKICSPNFFQRIFGLFSTFCTFSEKIWSKRNENRAKRTTPRRPPPHPAAGRGVFDFILPVPPIRLFLTTVDMCYLILWNLRDFLTF